MIVSSQPGKMLKDKLGKWINKKGYLIDFMTGDIVEIQQGKMMFMNDDVDERGEIPGPFCVEMYNFNTILDTFLL